LLGDFILDGLGGFEPGPELIHVLIEDFSQAPSGELRQDDDAPPQVIF